MEDLDSQETWDSAPPMLQVIHTQQGKKGRGRLLLKFDIGSFHFYSITYHSRSQRIAV